MKNLLLMEESEFKELILKIDRIENYLLETEKGHPEKSGWLSNDAACTLLNVTPRTMQKYRDNGVLSFSKVGSKIYYKRTDLEKHLESYYYTSFNSDRRGE